METIHFQGVIRMEASKNYNIITFVLFISGILIMFNLYTAIPITEHLANDFGISQSVAAMNGVVFSVTYSISCLFYGTISEKFGRIRVILLSLIGLIIVCFLIGFVTSFNTLLILRGLQGIFAATFSPIAITYTTETYPLKKRLTAVSFISTSFMLSGILGQNFSEILISQFDWHIIFFILSSLYICLAIIIFRNVPESPVKNSDVQILKYFSNFKDFAKNRKVLICYFISLTLLTTFISMYAVINEFILSDSIHGDNHTAFLVKLFGVFGMLSSLMSGRISSRYGVKFILNIALGVCGVTLILMPFAHNILLITFLSICFVAGIAFAVPLVIAKVNMVVYGNRGFFLSVNTFILFLGTAVAPILSIYLTSLNNFTSMFVIISSIAFLAFLASLFLPSDEQTTY